MMVLVLFAAWNTGTNLLYIVFGGLASFYLISRVMAGRMLAGVKTSVEAPSAVHRGDICPVTLRIENRKWLLPSMALRAVWEDRPDSGGGFVMQLPARRAAVLRITTRFDKRGVFPVPPIRLSSAFPFGLIETRKRIEKAGEVVVYPRVRAVRLGRVDHKTGSGDVPKTGEAKGDEFYSLREYNVGDDVRRIAWRQSARLGELLVKELELETSRYILFVLDTAVDPALDAFETHFEEAVELVASLATTLLSRHYRVGLETPMGALEEGEGKGQAIKILDYLARIAPAAYEGQPRFGFVRHHDNRRCTHVYVSADPSLWGVSTSFGGPKILDPAEVLHA